MLFPHHASVWLRLSRHLHGRSLPVAFGLLMTLAVSLLMQPMAEAASSAGGDGSVSATSGGSPNHNNSNAPADVAQRKLSALDSEDTSSDTQQLREIYNDIIQLSQDQQQYQRQANAYDQQLKNFSEQTRELQRRIQNYRAATTNSYANQSLEQLQQALSIKNADLYNLQNNLSAARNNITSINDRSLTAREELNQRKTELDQVNDAISQQPASTGEPLGDAQGMELQAKRGSLQSEIRMLELELLSVPNRATLAEQRRQLLQLQADDVSQQVDALQKQISLLRRQDTERTVEANRKLSDQATDSPPLIKQQLAENESLSQDLTELTSDIEKGQAKNDQIEQQTRRLSQRYQELRKQLDLLKVSVAFGETLRNEVRDLPQAMSTKELNTELTELQVKVYDYDQRLDKLQNKDKILEGYSNDPDFQALSEEDRKTFRQLLDVREQILSKLSDSASSYISTLAQLDLSNSQLQQQLDQFHNLVDEHLLWVPSARTISLSWISGMAHAATVLFSPHQWAPLWDSLAADQVKSLVVGVLIIALLALAHIARRRNDSQASKLAARLGKVSQDGFGLTLQLISLALLASAPWGLAFMALAWLVHQNSDANIVLAMQQGLLVLGALATLHLLNRRFSSPEHLYITHFNWPAAQVALIRRISRRLFWVAMPAIFFITLTENHLDDQLRNTLGRLAFMVLSAGLALYYWRIFKDRRLWLGDEPTGARKRGYLLLHWGFPLSQLILLGLTIQGYYFSALLINIKLHMSFFAASVFYIVQSLAIRWLLIEERRLAFSRAKARRADVLAQRAKEKEAEAAGQVASAESTIEAPEENLIDLQTVSEQSRKVLNLLMFAGLIVTLWGIWSDLFTSLSFLDQVKLWDASTMVNGTAELAPISLKAALLALLVFIVTFVGVRNLPGVLELLILQRIELTPGTGYAITTLSKYILVIIGVLAGFSILGFDWSKLQWLVAALGVGLGFGLQEIFANFISGLILLFEKPIRIGDTVTINGLTGTITKIQIRATTIVDWDRKEIVMPNKTFITQQVVNWSLTDDIARVVTTVGIAYGADTELAEKLIMQATSECELVLDTPPPEVFFMRFNNSTLDFDLRYFVNDLGHLLPSKHMILNRINSLFKENGVEIAFPQLDIHIKQDRVKPMLPEGAVIMSNPRPELPPYSKDTGDMGASRPQDGG
ncbi:mechanosensitive ion channel domain-containing protein [Pokkaliibacter sp. CJK22405]|uniref:mechanosensitive ion channel domain-containing protein n=1 Tax=Pokkaliibacter sp. CJK22405 TaxID=3384615 RepID=UPI003984B0F0